MPIIGYHIRVYVRPIEFFSPFFEGLGSHSLHGESTSYKIVSSSKKIMFLVNRIVSFELYYILSSHDLLSPSTAQTSTKLENLN